MDLYEIRRCLQKGQTIYELPLKVTFYARVSTDKYEQEHSLYTQVQYYDQYIQKNCYWSYVKGYVDEGLSGTSVHKRKAFLQMIEDAKIHKFDFIITKEISRFSRNTLDSIHYTQELLRYGVGVLFQSDNINTLMPDAELRLTLMSSIAQDEVRKISERVRFGFKRSIENGVVLGNNKIWGYKKDKGKLQVVEEEAKIVSLIFHMYAVENMGIRKISAHLQEVGYVNSNGHPFSYSTIKNILVNPKYKGFYCGNKTYKYDYKYNERKHIDPSEWILYPDEEKVPPIVSEALWEKANALLLKRGKQMKADKSSYQNKYAYSGKIICKEHGVSFHRSLYRYASKNKEVWQCRFYAQKGKQACDSPVVYTEDLNKLIFPILQESLGDFSKLIERLVKIYDEIEKMTDTMTDIRRLEANIHQMNKRKEKLLDLAVMQKISDDEFQVLNEQLNEKIAESRKKVEEYQKQSLNQGGGKKNEMKGQIKKTLQFTQGFTPAIVDALIEKIEVYKQLDRNKAYLKITTRTNQAVKQYCIERHRKKQAVYTAIEALAVV